MLYAPDDQGNPAQPRWHSKTHGRGAFAVMQGDGNLVVYTENHDVLWHAFADGGAPDGDFLQLQDDGNLVIYDTANASAPQWKWRTGTKWFPSSIQANSHLLANTALQSPDGRYELWMRGDGNLVLYGPGGWAWHTGTEGKGANRLAIQGDGNLVVRTVCVHACSCYTSRWRPWCSVRRCVHG